MPVRSRSMTTSTTACWNEAQRSATSWSESGAILSASSRSAVLRPESEKSALGASEHRPRQRKARGLPRGRFLLDLRPARIAEAEQLRGLVEGLADGVVDGGAEPHVVADAAHRDDLGVPAGGEEQAIGKRRAVGQPRGQRMRFQVVDRDQRLVADERDRLGGGQADDDAADQAGAGRGGDAVEPSNVTCASAIALAMTRSSASTWARAAISGTTPPKAACSSICDSTMLDRILPGPSSWPLDHGGRGLVAGRLDAEDNHRDSHRRQHVPTRLSGISAVPMIAHGRLRPA